MRVKLNFIFQSDYQCTLFQQDQELITKFKKIVFPINLKEMTTVADLKFVINSFLFKKGVKSLCVESLMLDSFILMEEFELGLVLNNDDEIKYLFILLF
jgi:hypothetical protein